MPLHNDRKYEIVVFGATGFTGGLVAEYLAQNESIAPDKWAIAGRNRTKLEAVKNHITALNPGCSAVDIIEADSADNNALEAMTAQASTVVTTVGPYAFYGEPLVKACIAQQCHYLDITGEPNFVRDMLERYDAAARERGVLIINCCGFDSIPADLGAYFTARQFSDPAVLTVKAFVTSKGQFSGGTWASALNAMAEGVGKKGSKSSSKRPRRRIAQKIHYDKAAKRWAVPMPVIDPWMVRRSADALPEVYGSDFEYGHFLGMKSPFTVAALVGGVGLVYAGAQVKPIRKMMLNFRKSGEGPSAEERAGHFFRLTFYAESMDSQRKVKTYVQGGDPGYTETSKMPSESALTLLTHYHELKTQGGVVTPAMALGNHLVARLQAAGIVFNAQDL